jgi:2'-5' RNA ligase
MRAFVALDVSSAVRPRIEALENELKPRLPSARFVAGSNLHFTLRFLGEADPGRVHALAGALRAALSVIPAFTLQIKGCGAFPSARRPRILWLSVENPPRSLFEAQRAVERVVRDAGFSPEERPFEPHLTIARFRGAARSLESVLASVRDRELGPNAIDEVVVYESRLSPRGSTYVPLHRLPLALSDGTGQKRLV